MSISWNKGDGDGVLVLAKKEATVNKAPVCGNTYSSAHSFGEGENLGDNNFVVYNGNDASVNIDGLNASTNYHFAFYEYNVTDSCYLFPAETANVKTKSIESSIEGAGMNRFGVYPNPASSNIQISLSLQDLPVKLEIVDMSGKKVLERWVSDRQVSIDIQNWNKGAYVVKLYVNDEIWKEKLIVK